MSPGQEDQYLSKIAELEKTLKLAQDFCKETEVKAKEANEKFIRLYAEFENYRKRVSKEKEETVRYGYEKIVHEILPVLDGLENALAHASETQDKQPLIEGVEMVLKQFLKAAENFGLKQLESVSQPFDPNYHEAMAQFETDEHEPDTVMEEHRRGYQLYQRLLRPALVTVAKPMKKS